MKQILFFFFLANIAFAQNAHNVVKAVHDGDSYRIETTDWLPGEDTILVKTVSQDWYRLEGVDCPELYWPGHISATQPFGREIGDSVRMLIKGKAVSVERFGLDGYGRPLVRIILPDGRDLAQVILSRGWGVYVRNDLPASIRRKYQRARDKAKSAGIVIWSDKSMVTPETWRKTHK